MGMAFCAVPLTAIVFQPLFAGILKTVSNFLARTAKLLVLSLSKKQRTVKMDVRKAVENIKMAHVCLPYSGAPTLM